MCKTPGIRWLDSALLRSCPELPWLGCGVSLLRGGEGVYNSNNISHHSSKIPPAIRVIMQTITVVAITVAIVISNKSMHGDNGSTNGTISVMIARKRRSSRRSDDTSGSAAAAGGSRGGHGGGGESTGE